MLPQLLPSIQYAPRSLHWNYLSFTLYARLLTLRFVCISAVVVVNVCQGLPFQKVVHQVVTYDAQPMMSVQPQGILVFVNGNMKVDDSEHPMKFAQVFHLLPDPSQPGQYWVASDVFRLNYG